MKLLHYKAITPLSFYQILNSAILVGIFTLLLGYAYSVMTIVNPFIFLNVVICFSFATTLGYSLRIIFRITHNNSKNSRIVIAVVSGLLFSCFQWLALLLYLENETIPSLIEYSKVYWLISSEAFYQHLLFYFINTKWIIYGYTISGFGLALIYFFEASLIIGMPLIIISKTKIYPYSEKLRKWYPKYTLSKEFETIANADKLTDKIIKSPIEAINELFKGTAIRYSKIHIYYTPEEDKSYITFDNVYIEKQGRGEKNKDAVINNLTISKSTAEAILEIYDNMKEKFDVF